MCPERQKLEREARICRKLEHPNIGECAVHVSTCVCVCVCVHAHVCVRVCACVCVYPCTLPVSHFYTLLCVGGCVGVVGVYMCGCVGVLWVCTCVCVGGCTCVSHTQVKMVGRCGSSHRLHLTTAGQV